MGSSGNVLVADEWKRGWRGEMPAWNGRGEGVRGKNSKRKNEEDKLMGTLTKKVGLPLQTLGVRTLSPVELWGRCVEGIGKKIA